MSQTPKDVLRDEIRKFRDKLCYFLLSASGASMAFGLTQMSELSSPFAVLIMAFAVTVWGISFYCGMRFLEIDEGLLFAEVEYHEMVTERIGSPSQLKLLLDEATQSQRSGAEMMRKSQLIFLLAGALLYALVFFIAKVSEFGPPST